MCCVLLDSVFHPVMIDLSQFCSVSILSIRLILKPSFADSLLARAIRHCPAYAGRLYMICRVYIPVLKSSQGFESICRAANLVMICIRPIGMHLYNCHTNDSCHALLGCFKWWTTTLTKTPIAGLLLIYSGQLAISDSVLLWSLIASWPLFKQQTQTVQLN